MIIEENLLGWNKTPVKSKEVIYPQSRENKAPKNYFLCIFCGSVQVKVIYLLNY
jgi:hypothetical protein